MSSNTNLSNKTVNRLLKLMEGQKAGASTLPPEVVLSKKLDVSRTMIRKAIQILIEKKIIVKSYGKTRVLRAVKGDDFLPVQSDGLPTQDRMHRFFLDRIKNGDIRPGLSFSVLQLATESGFNRTIVRDFLNAFSKFGLIEKHPRKNWRMINIDQPYIQDLMDARKTLELDALNGFLKLTANSPLYISLEKTTEKLSHVLDTILVNKDKILAYETEFFKTLMKVKSNRFISDFYSRLCFTCSVLDQYCLIDETDSITNKLTFILSLSDDLFNRNQEKYTGLMNDYYHTAMDMYLGALNMLELG